MSSQATLNTNGSVTLSMQPPVNLITHIEITRGLSGQGLAPLANVYIPQGTATASFTDNSADIDATYDYGITYYTNAGNQWASERISGVQPYVGTFYTSADVVNIGPNPWVPNVRYTYGIVTGSTPSGWTFKAAIVSDPANGVMTNDPTQYYGGGSRPLTVRPIPYDYVETLTWQFVYQKTGHADKTYTVTQTFAETGDPPPAVPTAPPNLRTVVDTPTEISITWDPSTSAGATQIQYEVSRQKPTDGGPVVLVASQTGQTYDDTAPGALRPVMYWVRANASNPTGSVWGPYSMVSDAGIPDSCGVLQG